MRPSFALATPLLLTILFMLSMLHSLLGAPAPAVADPAAASVNALGLDLLRHESKPDANFLVSPYSIQSALAMAYAGADGATRQEMANVLHYPREDTSLHNSFARWRKEIEEVVRRSEEYSKRSSQYSTNDPLALNIANRLFGQSGYGFREPFLNLLNDVYAAPFESLDFRKSPAQAARHINDWVETQTRQRIRNLIPDSALSDLTRLVLINALYLKAPWNYPFEVSATKPDAFYVNGDQRIEVPMMHQTDDLPFAQGNGFVAVMLPLSYPFHVVVFLPGRQTGLAQFEKQLSSNLLVGNLKWQERSVTLSLPRFKLEPATLPLSDTLQKLGLKTAFDIPLRSANFDRIAPRRPDEYLFLSQVFHKTYLNVEENGIEAAAATAVAVAAAAGIHEPPKPVEVRVDHPFFFTILARSTADPQRESRNPICLFLGHVTDPR